MPLGVLLASASRRGVANLGSVPMSAELGMGGVHQFVLRSPRPGPQAFKNSSVWVAVSVAYWKIAPCDASGNTTMRAFGIKPCERVTGCG